MTLCHQLCSGFFYGEMDLAESLNTDNKAEALPLAHNILRILLCMVKNDFKNGINSKPISNPKPTVHRPPSTVHRLPSTVNRLPSTVHRQPSTLHRLPSTAPSYHTDNSDTRCRNNTRACANNAR
jgi:hypothetical protein